MLILKLLSALGLFLLGIWLMTEGLKLAGGKALEHLLNRWTSTKVRSLGSGVLITTLVQSSAAVIIATIGFINAGLMTFSQSLWVVFGSGLGSTFTGWLVTLFGFKLNIGVASALPLAIGAFLRLFAPYERGRFLGMALAGFGLMFMGIDVMKTTFAVHVQELNILALFEDNQYQITIGFFIGFIITILTQASSAAIAIILTATASNIVGFEVAGAAVIGANLGSTSTSVIAMLGATSSAKRLALAHVMFNGTSSLLGLLALPLLVSLYHYFSLGDNSFHIALALVMFHTTINVFGIIAMVPLEPYLRRFLSGLFEKDSIITHKKKHQFIDSNVAEIPDLALRALQLELKQLYQKVHQLSLFKIIYNPSNPLTEIDFSESTTEISHFIIQASQANLTREQSTQFTEGLAAVHYLQNSFHALEQIRQEADTAQRLDHQLLSAINPWLEKINVFAGELDNNEANSALSWDQLHEEYLHLKKHLLASAFGNQQRLGDIDNALLLISLVKRYIEQLMHSCALIDHLEVKPETEDEAIEDEAVTA